MTDVVYVPVLVETVEQSQSLPEGTQRLQDGREGLAVGWTALVPVEVVTDWGVETYRGSIWEDYIDREGARLAAEHAMKTRYNRADVVKRYRTDWEVDSGT